MELKTGLHLVVTIMTAITIRIHDGMQVQNHSILVGGIPPQQSIPHMIGEVMVNLDETVPIQAPAMEVANTLRNLVQAPS